MPVYVAKDPKEYLMLNGTAELLENIEYSSDPMKPWTQEEWEQNRKIIVEYLTHVNKTIEDRIKE